MTQDLINQAETELADIERKLAALEPLRQRREQLRTWIMLTRQVYPDLAPASVPYGQAQPDASNPAQFSFLAGAMRPRKTETQKDRVIAAAIEIIQTEGPMISRLLADRLKARGVEVGGADAASSVSSILSRNAMFKSDRSAGGWVLSQPHNEETPLGAPTPTGS